MNGLARKRFATARRLRREMGFRGLLYAALRRAEPVCGVRPDWFVVFEQVLGRPLEPGARLGDLRWAGSDDAGLLEGLGEHPSEIARRLTRGDRAAFLADGAGMVAYVWFRRREYDEEGMVFTLGDDELWMYDLIVAPEHRGRRLGPGLIVAAGDDLSREGSARLVWSVDVLNRASLRSTRAAGAAPVGAVVMVKAFGLCVCRETWEHGRPRWRVGRLPMPGELPPVIAT